MSKASICIVIGPVYQHQRLRLHKRPKSTYQINKFTCWLHITFSEIKQNAIIYNYFHIISLNNVNKTRLFLSKYVLNLHGYQEFDN